MQDLHPHKQQAKIKEVTQSLYPYREYIENEKQGNKKPNLESAEVFKYYADGRKMETDRFIEGKLEKRFIHNYNDRKQLMEIVELGFSGSYHNSENPLKGKIEGKEIYKYNWQNQLIEIIQAGPLDFPLKKTVFHYNSKGLLEEEIFYYNMRNMDFKHQYSYNEKLQLISETTTFYQKKDDPMKIFFEYVYEGREKISIRKNNSGE